MKSQVSNGQLFFIIFITLVCFTSISLPKTLAESAGTGAWITILISAVFFIICAAIIASLGNKYQDITLFEYSQKIVGKPITYVFASIYIVYFFSILSFILRIAGEIIKANFLIKTPLWAIVLPLIFVSCYCASKGVTNIGRTFFLFGFIYLIVNTAIFIALLSYGDTRNILPLFEKSEIIQYFKASLKIITAFLGFEVITVIPFTNKNGKKVVWIVASAIFVVALFYILLVESCFSVLDLKGIVFFIDPLLVAIRRIEIPFLEILKRLDALFFTTWISAICASISIVAYTVNEYLRKFIPKFNKIALLYIIGGIAAIVGISIPSYKLVLKLFETITNYLGFFTAFLIPLILFIVGKVRKNENTN